ncbi:hypothetical protein EVAR_68761_1 [Eumeta japonica]|uniref:Uncharacterized protein n=1 Tax=Eumeta variegata TaxID=151549 RepID=A0A4C2A955_EUMVA|nr:hypothetical protein EVAR_68761_1 [Eumeta japonica]
MDAESELRVGRAGAVRYKAVYTLSTIPTLRNHSWYLSRKKLTRFEGFIDNRVSVSPKRDFPNTVPQCRHRRQCTAAMKEQFSQRTPKVSRHQAVHYGVDGGVGVTCKFTGQSQAMR